MKINKTAKKMAKEIDAKRKSVRVCVFFTPEQMKVIDKKIGVVGNTRADVVRTIVLSFLYSAGKQKTNKNGDKKHEF